jgi:hypothetical protein
MAGRGRSLLKWLSIVGVAIIALVFVAGCFLMFTGNGRALAARGICDAINGGIAGKLEIGHISELGLGALRAHDVVIRAPDGQPAIEVAETRIDYDLWGMVTGTQGWDRAEIDDCRVHVTEDKRGKVNMEETFKSRTGDKPKEPKEPKDESGSAVDLRTMVTSRCFLYIGGGSLPPLELVDLFGIMRVYVAPDGKTDLRFDDYRGRIVKGLPTGVLDFEAVTGKVQTQQKQLLEFVGKGKSEGADVAFNLAIATEPKKRVKIDAKFPELSAGAARAMFVSAYSSFSSTIEMNVDTNR